MGFYYFEGIGTVHIREAKRLRVIPGPERHNWDGKPEWGESATCVKCGCVKRRKKTRPDWMETYQMPGGAEVQERPSCQRTESTGNQLKLF